jgi:hypothetical protein
MCHYGHIRLNPSERKEVARWTGIMLPVYASVALFVLAALVVIHQPRTGEMIAAAPASDSNPAGH